MGYEVIKQIIMKIILFWDVMPFSPLQIYQRCTKNTHNFHLHGKNK